MTKEEVECKSCGRIIRKGKFQFDAPEGRICLDCYHSRRASIKEWHESPIFEILKVVGGVILFLLVVGAFLALVLFVILGALGAEVGEALEVIGLLINPFLIFKFFGWIGIGVWLIIWLIVAVVGFFGFGGKS